MKLNENRNKTLQIRLSEEELNYLKVIAYMGGMNSSSFVRAMIDASINALKVQMKKGDVDIEHIKALLDDQL